MRIYEIAKEAGVTSADVLKAAEAAGVGASSAISTLTGDEAGRIREALKGADASAAKAKREAKRSKAAELNAQFFAEQKTKLEEHLRIAKEVAEGAQVKVKGEGEQRKENSSVHLNSSPSPAKPAKPVIRMAPGYKPKPVLPAVSAAQTGLTASSGFKPLQHAKPASTISISVAVAPKVRPPKPANESYDEDERGTRKGKKGREGQKSFDKRVPRIAPQVPQQGGHISVNEESK